MEEDAITNTAFGSEKPATNVPADAVEKGAAYDVVSGTAFIPTKTADIIQVGGAEMTPRRAMYDATTDTADDSGKPATTVPANAA